MLEWGEVLDIDTHYFKIFVPNYEDRVRLGSETYVRVADLFDITAMFVFIIDQSNLKAWLDLTKCNMRLSTHSHQSSPYP